jgi:hypothetical protein
MEERAGSLPPEFERILDAHKNGKDEEFGRLSLF